MRLDLFSAKAYEREPFERANRQHGHELRFLEARLTRDSAALAEGAPAVCAFVNDVLDAAVLRRLREGGAGLVALRSAGFNHVDVRAAERLGIELARVPEYSPAAVAEHTVALMLTLNRKLHRAYRRVSEQNFSLDGLLGFDMQGKTVGVIGTGSIGTAVCRILRGFGCRLLAFDPRRSPECEALGVESVALERLYREADIVTLHCPLSPRTHHLIGREALAAMKPGVMLVNTSRGAVIDTKAVIEALKGRHVGSLGIDVYEEEGDLFFRDLSDAVIDDDVFARLMTFPNVVITAHQGFFTREALDHIAATTLRNVSEHAAGGVDASQRVSARLLAEAGGDAPA